jgi:hypothetical protein
MQVATVLNSLTAVVPAVVAQLLEQVVSPAVQALMQVTRLLQLASFAQALYCDAQAPPALSTVFWQVSQVAVLVVEPVALVVEPVVLVVEPVPLVVDPVMLVDEPLVLPDVEPMMPVVEPVLLVVEPLVLLVVEPVLDVTEPLHQLVIAVAALLQLLQLAQANTCPSLVV